MINTSRRISKLIGSETGGSMVEFAIVLPLFLLLVFGVIEFSLLLYNKAMLTNAAREGARYGIVESPEAIITETEIKKAVTDYCQNHMITFGGSVTVDPDVVIIAEDGTERNYNALLAKEYLKVTANYSYTFLILPNIFKLINATGISDLPSTLTLTAVSEMRAE